MADFICPICQRPNDPNAERCWYCQAVLSQDQPQKPVGGTDWLNGLREESNLEDSAPFVPESGTPEPAEEKPEEVPDWLARIRTREQFERETQVTQNPPEEPAPPREDLPDWLKEIKSGSYTKKADQEAQAAEPEPVAPFEVPTEKSESTLSSPPSHQDGQDDTEEWLNKLAAWQPAEENEQPSEKSPFNLEDLKPNKSDQFRGREDQTPQFNLDALSDLREESDAPAELDQTKGWQRLFPEDGTENPPSPGQTQQTPAFPAASQQPELTDFDFESLEKKIFTEPANSAVANPEANSQDKSEISATEDIFTSQSQPAKNSEGDDNTPFLPDDLPDWLATASISKTDRKSSEPVSERLDSSILEGSLEKTLPPWLQAIRPAPKETPNGALQAAAEGGLSEEGLLAGISGTLQKPLISADIRRPVGYGSALKVSDRQKANANLLANLVEEAFEDQEVNIPKKSKFQRVFGRLVLALIMIALLFIGKGYLTEYAVQPALFAPEVVSAFDALNALPAGQPILITADFEAATSGELSLSSQSLLEHLMRRNLNLVILSTNPAGAAMLTQQLQTVSQKVAGYDLDAHLVNLGYLPGGSTGLQLMASDPRSALPYTHDFNQAWESQILHSVESLADFGAVVVIGDNAENARVWIEQIQPALDSTPLLFVISAQAAPLLQPYYQSGQVTGYVSGYYGSLSYEQILQQPTGMSAYLGSYQTVILFVAILILLSGLVNLVRPPSSKRKGVL